MEHWQVWVDVLVLLAIGALGLFIKSFLPSYMNEKAKNLATREDVEGITKQVEQAKLVYSKELKEFESRLANTEQSRQLRLQKLEELITAVSGFRTWLEKETNSRLLLKGEAEIEAPIHRAEMLTALYFPECEPELSALRAAHLDAVKWLASAKTEISMLSDDPVQQAQALTSFVTDRKEFFARQRALGDATIAFERQGRAILVGLVGK